MSSEISILEKWLSKFKEILIKDKRGSQIPIYVLNKDYLKFPEKRGNLNEKLLKENILDYKNSSFYLLNEEKWKIINSKYPTEKQLKYNSSIFNNKCYFSINNHIYYFYFINENKDIEEGYFEFTKDEYGSYIISIFTDLNLEDFLIKMKIKKSNEEQIINYDGSSYIFKIKGKNNQNINEALNEIKNNFDNKYNINNNPLILKFFYNLEIYLFIYFFKIAKYI